MVAKITIIDSLFGALAYNQNKVDAEKAQVLCSNKVAESPDGRFQVQRCITDFLNQMPQDIKTEKPFLHISLNPHPDDVLSDSQLSEIAQGYLEKLGYGRQPYIVYKHEDIQRHHLHIVTLRVGTDGKKIDDTFEHRRSKNITRELERKYGLCSAEKRQKPEDYTLHRINADTGDVKQQLSNTLKTLVKNYHFQSIGEYRALLSVFNIQVEEVKGVVRDTPYNGIVYSALNEKGEKVGNPFKASQLGKAVGYDALQKKYEQSAMTLKDQKLKDRTKREVATCMKSTGTRQQLERALKDKGISVVFRQNAEGRIYGATFIDHTTHTVLNGSRLGKEYSANVFNDLFNHPDRQEDNRNEQPADHFTLHPRPSQQSENDFTQWESTPERNEGCDIGSGLAGIFSILPTSDEIPPDNGYTPLLQKKKKRRQRRL